MKLPHEKRFHFPDGSSASSLDELRDKIETISYDTFYHHVDGSKNDFASWVRYVLKDEHLADELQKVNSIVETVEILNDYLQPNATKRHLAEQDDVQSKIEHQIGFSLDDIQEPAPPTEPAPEMEEAFFSGEEPAPVETPEVTEPEELDWTEASDTETPEDLEPEPMEESAEDLEPEPLEESAEDLDEPEPITDELDSSEFKPDEPEEIPPAASIEPPSEPDLDEIRKKAGLMDTESIRERAGLDPEPKKSHFFRHQRERDELSGFHDDMTKLIVKDFIWGMIFGIIVGYILCKMLGL